MSVDQQHLRMAEALLFAATEPLDTQTLEHRLPDGVDVPAVMAELAALYEGRGVNLVKVAGRYAFRTAEDLAFLMKEEREVPRRLSRAGVETLAIIAYHQPITRAEIEEVRGVGLSKGTLDVLLESGWVRPRGRRRTPGRPVTYGVSDSFLIHFGLESIEDLPGVEELKAAGLLSATPPAGFATPTGAAAMPGVDDAGEETEDEDETEEDEDDEAEDAGVVTSMGAADR